MTVGSSSFPIILKSRKPCLATTSIGKDLLLVICWRISWSVIQTKKVWIHSMIYHIARDYWLATIVLATNVCVPRIVWDPTWPHLFGVSTLLVGLLFQCLRQEVEVLPKTPWLLASCVLDVVLLLLSLRYIPNSTLIPPLHLVLLNDLLGCLAHH